MGLDARYLAFTCINAMMDKRGYVLDLGLIDYGRAWEIQHLLWKRRVEGSLPDLLLLLEHEHVITLGRRGNRSHLMASPEALRTMHIPLFHIERGGDVTYHGPGQLVAYPILDLKGYGYRLIRYVEQLEEVVIRVLRDFGIEGRRDPMNRGVWVGGEKIAAVGVAIKRWVSFHGVALNYETDLTYFDLMNPCGLVGKKMTTMEKVVGAKISRDRLRERFLSRFSEIFEMGFEERAISQVLPDLGLSPEALVGLPAT